MPERVGNSMSAGHVPERLGNNMLSEHLSKRVSIYLYVRRINAREGR